MKKLILCAALIMPLSAHAIVDCEEVQSMAITMQYANQNGVPLHRIYASIEKGYDVGTFGYDLNAALARSAYQRKRYAEIEDQMIESISFGDQALRACEKAKANSK